MVEGALEEESSALYETFKSLRMIPHGAFEADERPVIEYTIGTSDLTDPVASFRPCIVLSILKGYDQFKVCLCILRLVGNDPLASRCAFI